MLVLLVIYISTCNRALYTCVSAIRTPFHCLFSIVVLSELRPLSPLFHIYIQIDTVQDPFVRMKCYDTHHYSEMAQDPVLIHVGKVTFDAPIK